MKIKSNNYFVNLAEIIPEKTEDFRPGQGTLSFVQVCSLGLL